jgi:hypothetical protein
MKNQADVIAVNNIKDLNILAEGLQCEIGNSIYDETDPNTTNWDKQVGILISRHEAELFLELLVNYMGNNE